MISLRDPKLDSIINELRACQDILETENARPMHIDSKPALPTRYRTCQCGHRNEYRTICKKCGKEL